MTRHIRSVTIDSTSSSVVTKLGLRPRTAGRVGRILSPKEPTCRGFDYKHKLRKRTNLLILRKEWITATIISSYVQRITKYPVINIVHYRDACWSLTLCLGARFLVPVCLGTSAVKRAEAEEQRKDPGYDVGGSLELRPTTHRCLSTSNFQISPRRAWNSSQIHEHHFYIQSKQFYVGQEYWSFQSFFFFTSYTYLVVILSCKSVVWMGTF